MKNLRNVMFFVLVTAVPFLGCKKGIDQFFPNGIPSGIEQQGICQITSFVYEARPFEHVYTFTVHYNSAGDPDSAVSVEGAGMFFKYNGAHQLVEYKSIEPNATRSVNTIHLYSYEAGRIVKDSTSTYSIYSDPDIGFSDTYDAVTLLTYDTDGRIIKETGSGSFFHSGIDASGELFIDITYVYDGNGNLVGNYLIDGEPPTLEPIMYDQKIGYLRTNPIWMFLSRNYSRNNETGAKGYTSLGLPVGFFPAAQPGLQGIFRPLFYQTRNPLEITYKCRTDRK
jgi:hypothetical protein